MLFFTLAALAKETALVFVGGYLLFLLARCTRNELIGKNFLKLNLLPPRYLPLAATLTTEDVFAAFLGEYREFKTFFHGHSYTGNALACAAALANLEIFDRERVLETCGPKIELLTQRLKEEVEPLSHVGDVRQCGFMVGIELVKDRDTKEPAPELAGKVRAECHRRGLLVEIGGHYDNVVRFLPPLVIEKDQIDEVWAAIEDELDANGRPLIVTGHSLGAGLAVLAAARPVDLGHDVESVYLYGSPRPGLVQGA